AMQELEHTVVQRVELFRREFLIEASPRYRFLSARIEHGEFVFRSASGERCRVADDGPVRSQLALVAADGLLYQFSGEKIAVHVLLLRQKLIEVERLADRLRDHKRARSCTAETYILTKRVGFAAMYSTRRRLGGFFAQHSFQMVQGLRHRQGIHFAGAIETRFDRLLQIMSSDLHGHRIDDNMPGALFECNPRRMR